MKRFLALFLSAVMLFLLCGCAAKKDNSFSLVKKGITLTAEEYIIPDGTRVKITAGDSTAYKKALLELADKYKVYNITAKYKKINIQPGGKIVAKINIPEGYDENKVCIVMLSGSKVTLLPTAIYNSEKIAYAYLDTFGCYAIAQLKGEPLRTDISQIKQPSGTPLCNHNFQAATCSAPKTCMICGKTEGEPSEHNWGVATCSRPKTCLECGKTKGSALAHTFKDGVCAVCGQYDNMYMLIENSIWETVVISNSKAYVFKFMFIGEKASVSVEEMEKIDTLSKEMIKFYQDRGQIKEIEDELYYFFTTYGTNIKYTEKGKTVTVKVDDTTLVMERESNDTYKIKSMSKWILNLENVELMGCKLKYYSSIQNIQ